MSANELEKALDGLNPTQRDAVNVKDGATLVLAGPGSGKTQVLTCRIAQIINSSPDENFRVLALTFTTKAANEMRNRVTKYVPNQENRVFIGTFHSFCADILRQHGSHLGIMPNFNIYSQTADLQAILDEAIEEVKIESDYDYNSLRRLLPTIQSLKSNLVLPERAKEYLKNSPSGEIIASIYNSYESRLSEHNALDFDSLILKVYQLFTQYPTFAKRYRLVYPYICIDEFQDTNEAQYKLIRAIADKSSNLFVVADDDQIIYQWNGASYKRLSQFIHDYLPSILQLYINYRCPSEIVQLANNLISHNLLRTPNKKPLVAFKQNSGNKTVRLLPAFPDFNTEAKYIAKDIKKNYFNQLGDVTVLGRSRRVIERVEQELHTEGIPAIISQRKDEFESNPMIWLHSILRLANDRQNRKYLEAICGSFAQITSIETEPEDIIVQARSSNNDYLQHWIKNAYKKASNKSQKDIIDTTSQCLLEGGGWFNFNKYFFNWVSSITDIRNDTDTDSDKFVLYEEERLVWMGLVNEITESLGNNITLEALLQELQMRSKESPAKPNTVTLMTIHGSKGKEFSHVYLVAVFEDELPSFQSIRKGKNSPEMEEERRNCFVAITRSKDSLTISYSNNYRGFPKKPSRFLYEMGLLTES